MVAVGWVGLGPPETQDFFLAAMKVGTVKNPRAIDIVIFSIASTHQQPETILVFLRSSCPS